MNSSDDDTLAKLKRLFVDHVQGVAGAADRGNVDIKAPMRVEPFGASNQRGYWRVPYQLPSTSEAGYFDVRDLESPEPSIVRAGIPRPKRDATGSADPAVDLLAMDRTAIEKQIKSTFGSEAAIVQEPSLVFDRAETRIAWKVEVQNEGSQFVALVTPGFAWRPQEGFDTLGRDQTTTE